MRSLRGELAVLEWRLALKLSRFHRKVRSAALARLMRQTDLLSLFPVQLGQYAELTTSHGAGTQSEGWFKRGGRSVLSSIGMGSAPAVRGLPNLIAS